jgi:hypothetical protein
MSCEFCTDEDGDPCFPIFGLAPHSHLETGGTVFDEPKEIPGFSPSKDEPTTGIWWCEHCGSGKP